MSTSTKIVLRKKPNAQGLYPPAIRITKNRRSSYKQIGYYIELEDWDEKNLEVKKSHPESESLNNLITSKLSEVRKGLIALQLDSKDASARQIRRFSKDENLTFQEIDERFLKKLKVYLKGSCSVVETTAMNVMVFIRLLYNRAIKDKTVSQELYPFGNGKFKIKFPETTKVGLTEKEVKLLENLDDLSDSERHSLNVWLYSLYFAGMRVSDVLKTRWSQIYDGRLHYRMGKNSKLVSLKKPLKVDEILNQYIQHKLNEDDFVFPEMKKADLTDAKDIHRKIKVATKKFNDNLKRIALRNGIHKKLTMHIARHTFGHISEDKIPIKTLQKLYRHSSITTTINYQSNFIHKDADDALDSVINF